MSFRQFFLKWPVRHGQGVIRFAGRYTAKFPCRFDVTLSQILIADEFQFPVEFVQHLARLKKLRLQFERF